MLRRVEIDDDDLELAEQSLRGLAEIYCETAARQLSPAWRRYEERAKRCERIADQIKEARQPRSERA